MGLSFGGPLRSHKFLEHMLIVDIVYSYLSKGKMSE